MTSEVWDTISTITDQIPRDRWGRPIIPPAVGGPAKPYTRVTTLAETLDDRFNLEKWKQRQVAVGLMLRRDLLNLVAAQRNDKGALDKTCDEAIAAAAGGAAANTGVALHALTEQVHLGADHTLIPDHLREDIAAYQACLERHAIEVAEVEQFVVCEKVEAAGTLDRLMRIGDRLCIGDVKTGAGAIDYGLSGIAIQLAVYANAETSWGPSVGHRKRPRVDLTRAYVLHLVPGSGHCELVEVDIISGWEAAQTARWVRDWRKRKNLGRSVTTAANNTMFRREWIRLRILGLPDEGTEMLVRLAGDHQMRRVSECSDSELDRWAELLDMVDTEFDLPFAEPDPTQTKEKK